MLVATKAPYLPRPWPLLAEGQDPASLEARVAFHLHRLKLVGAALRRAGYDRNTAADIAAARTALSAPSLSTLAVRLGSELHELTRTLTADELRQWSYYRRAASDPQYVWATACSAWRAAGLSDKEAAAVTGKDLMDIAAQYRHGLTLLHVLPFQYRRWRHAALTPVQRRQIAYLARRVRVFRKLMEKGLSLFDTLRDKTVDALPTSSNPAGYMHGLIEDHPVPPRDSR